MFNCLALPGLAVAVLFCSFTSANAASVLLSSFNFGAGTYAYANHTGGTTGTLVIAAKGGGNYPQFVVNGGTTENAIAGDTAGDAIQLVGASNRMSTFTFSFDSRGYSNITFSFAGVTTFTSTSVGFTTNQISTSANGSTFAAFGSTFSPNAVNVTGITIPSPLTFKTVSFDLSSIVGLNNNATAAIRLTVDGGAGSNVIQLDNFQITGTPVAQAGPAAVVPLPPAAMAGVAMIGVGVVKRRRHR